MHLAPTLTGMTANFIKKNLFTGRRKWGLIITTTTMLLLVGGMLGYSLWLYPKLKVKLSDAIHSQVPPGGSLRYEALNFSLWNNKLWLEGLEVEQNGQDSIAKLQATVQKIEVQGINWRKLYFDKFVSLKQIRINAPRIKMIGQPFPKPNENQQDSSQAFLLKNLKIEAGHFEYFEPDDTMTMSFGVDSFQFFLTGIMPPVDRTAIPIQYQSFEAEIFRLNQLTDNRFYALKADRIHAHSQDRHLRIEGLHYQPQISRKAFSETRIGHIEAQLDTKVKVIHFQDIDLTKLITQQQISCRLTIIDSVSLTAFRDKSIPEIAKLRILPQQALMQLSWPLRVDTLRVTKGYIQYDELGPKSDEPGTIYFDQLYATFYNLTNHPDLLKKQAPTVDAQALFMGKGELQVQFQFFPLTPDFQYTYHGHLGNFAIENANQMVDPRLALVLESGMVHRLDFEVSANNQLSEGTMDFEYSNLNAFLQNNETNRKKKFLSFVADIVTHKDNLPSEKDYRQGNIYFKQIPEKPFFHNVWQSVFSGIRSTVFPNLLLKKELDVK